MISESVASADGQDEPLILALQRATHATLHVLAADLVDLGLTPSEINALANLADGRARSVAELSSATGTRTTTLTGVLDRLERRGHLTRRTHPDDRRSVLLELTEGGREAAVVVREAMRALEGRAVEGLSEEAVAGFRAVAHALREVS